MPAAGKSLTTLLEDNINPPCCHACHPTTNERRWHASSASPTSPAALVLPDCYVAAELMLLVRAYVRICLLPSPVGRQYCVHNRASSHPRYVQVGTAKSNVIKHQRRDEQGRIPSGSVTPSEWLDDQDRSPIPVSNPPHRRPREREKKKETVPERAGNE